MKKINRPSDRTFKAVAIGVSAGGLYALPKVLGPLPDGFAASVIVIQHMDPAGDHSFLIEYLASRIQLKIMEGVERIRLKPGHVYMAPANYHLYVEDDRTLGLSVDEKVNYSRPSIDVLFESAADAFGNSLIGIVLTGASSDGALGLKRIKENGGLVIVQYPETADTDIMPKFAIRTCPPDYILQLTEIPALLNKLVTGSGDKNAVQPRNTGQKPLLKEKTEYSRTNRS